MKNNKLFIIIAVCLVAVVALVSVLVLRGCGEQSNESSADVSVNTEVSEEASNTEISTGEVSEEVSEEISAEVSENISEPETSTPAEHTHEYADTWSSNETDHWKECECGSKSDISSHTFGEWTTTKEATEDAAGSKKHSCTVCGYEETATIPALSHTHKYADTWSSNETDHWKECNCGSKSEVSSHNYGDWTVTKEATEEAEGSKYHTCNTCGYKETVVIPALEHTHKYADTWKANETDHWKECKCGNKSNVASHNYGEWTTTEEATEEAEGSKYHTCKTCSYKETVTIPVLSHTHSFGDWKNNDTSHWKECRCGEKSEFASHAYGAWETVTEATCTATGTKKHTCTVCGYSETESIPVAEHTYGDWKSNATSHWKECKCGDKSELSSHTYGKWTTIKEATCTSTGTKKHTCTVCGYSETESIPVAEHTYGNWKSNATSHWKECKCGDKSELSSHTYGKWTTIKEATCTSTGTKKHTCTACGHSETENIPATGHSYGNWKSNSTSHWKECSKCGDIAEKANHAYGEWETVTDATCTATGTKKHTCTVCGYSETDTIPKADHTYGDWKNNSTNHWKECTKCGNKSDLSAHTYGAWETVTGATCTATGTKKHTCSACGYSETETISATGHSYGDWTVTKEATCTSSGTKKRTCTACDNSETATIFSKGHNYVSVVTKPTTTSKGYTTHTCSRCGDSYVDSYVDPIVIYSSGFSYKVNSDKTTCTITGRGSCTDANLKIPPKIDGYTVTIIGWRAFDEDTSITSVTIPNSVISIYDGGFENCTNLTSVTLGKGLTSIGDWAFLGCKSLTSITIPDSVTSLGDSVFSYCDALTSATIGNGVTVIPSYTFGYCDNLKTVTIGDGVTIIFKNAFRFCEKLTSVTIGKNVVEIGSQAFYGCSNLSSATFKDTYGWYTGGGDQIYVSDPSTAAKHLRDTYKYSTWYNKY